MRRRTKVGSGHSTGLWRVDLTPGDAIFRLPVYVVAGAALAGTFATSVVGVLVYSFLPLPGGGHASPDWALGTLFGLGGLAGMYLGAACQKYVRQRVLKAGLGAVLAGLGLSYLL